MTIPTYVCKSRPDWLELLGKQIYYKPVEVLAAYLITDRLHTVKEVESSLTSSKLWDTSYIRNDVIVRYKEYFPFKEPEDIVKTTILSRSIVRANSSGYCSGPINSAEPLQIITLEDYKDYLYKHQTLPDRLAWFGYTHYLGKLWQ